MEVALARIKHDDEPAVLRVIGKESKSKGTASLSSRQIDRIIKVARAQGKIGRKGKGQGLKP